MITLSSDVFRHIRGSRTLNPSPNWKFDNDIWTPAKLSIFLVASEKIEPIIFGEKHSTDLLFDPKMLESLAYKNATQVAEAMLRGITELAIIEDATAIVFDIPCYGALMSLAYHSTSLLPIGKLEEVCRLENAAHPWPEKKFTQAYGISVDITIDPKNNFDNLDINGYSLRILDPEKKMCDADLPSELKTPAQKLEYLVRNGVGTFIVSTAAEANDFWHLLPPFSIYSETFIVHWISKKTEWYLYD